jgi:hypothetical protein
MWIADVSPIARGQLVVLANQDDLLPLSYREVLSLLQSDSNFRDLLISVLSKAPFQAFRWETPPVSLAKADRRFEFVLLDSPGLVKSARFESFQEHFRNGETVKAFLNLGGDATLVVPSPAAPPSAYAHLAAFMRDAPGEQKHSLLQLAAAEVSERLGESPIWLSTAGAGVPWLHVRIDRTPKYYGHDAYRRDN